MDSPVLPFGDIVYGVVGAGIVIYEVAPQVPGYIDSLLKLVDGTKNIGNQSVNSSSNAGNSTNLDPNKFDKGSQGTNKIIKNAKDVIFNQSSLDKAFSKHSGDFGKYPDGSKVSIQHFREDVSKLINTGTQKSGSWKGVQGTHVYNMSTRQWAFINADGTFNTAFRLSRDQFDYLLKTGVVK